LKKKVRIMRTLDMYLQFRQELDKIWVPLLLDRLECVEHIVCDGKTVGMVAGEIGYIDCVYVLPEYRRKGLAKRAVLEWYARYGEPSTRLHIINNNETAKKFWNNLFQLKPLEVNITDTLYEIVRVK
jgi:ribosomal protein S18 acetylase RimI-like enzyme